MRKQKSKLSPDQQAAFNAVERSLPGYWSTGELRQLLNVTPEGISMQVGRGRLSPIRRKQGQEYLFTDKEVIRYLTRPVKLGRPPKHRGTAGETASGEQTQVEA